MIRRLTLSIALLCLMMGLASSVHAATRSDKCPPNLPICDGGDGPSDDDGNGGGGGDPAPCPVEVGEDVWRGCWQVDTESVAACANMEIGILRQWFERDPEQPDYWWPIRTDTHCVIPDDVGIDPWDVWAGVGLSSGGIGTELPGSEEIPIWTGYENGFWLEGDTEAYDSDSATEPLTGLTITVEVRGWPSEVTIDTGDDGPLSGNDDTATHTLNADDYGTDAYGSEDDPLFTHVYETKGTDAGHDCACFLASIEATWSGEYRWTMGGITTPWETFPQVIEAEPVEQPLQVWEVIGQLK